MAPLEVEYLEGGLVVRGTLEKPAFRLERGKESMEKRRRGGRMGTPKKNNFNRPHKRGRKKLEELPKD